MGEGIIKLNNVHKTFDGNEVVKGIDLDVREGEFLTLLGPSGCGKTTTLRMIAGFEDLTEGSVLIDGQDVTDLPPYKRPVNTVFQNYALFPHMNVYDNVAYGLTVRKIPKKEIKEKVSKALATVQLEGFEKRRSSQMSGGQKQRVAIARALVNDPRVLLLDEPLGALDFKLRKQMQIELKRLQKQLGITFIYVTHDQEEAMTMSDRVAVMHDGIIEQIDIPDKIYNEPKTRFVADFIGESNLFEATCSGLKEIAEAGFSVADAREFVVFETADGRCLGRRRDAEEGDRRYLCVRPEHMKASREPVEGFGLAARVSENLFTGNLIRTIAVLDSGKEVSLSRLADTEVYMPGETIHLYWDVKDCVTMVE